MENCENTAKIFKALCDPKRIAIIMQLRTGEKCACKLTDCLNIPQSALSYHMKILCESEIVQSCTLGKWTHYSISKKGSLYAIALLKELTSVDNSQIDSDCCDN